MTHIASRLAIPAHIPLLTLLMLGLAASTLVALKHEGPPHAAYTVAGYAADGSSTKRTAPYGSGAVLRNLLF